MSDSVHILLAEDNLADVRLIEEMLNQNGLRHTMDVAHDGEEALEYAESAGKTDQRRCPDLFVLDLHLPKVDGSEVLRRFRANEKCAETPVIVLSGILSPTVQDSMKSYPGVSCLLKPSNLDEMKHMGRFIQGVIGGVLGRGGASGRS